MEYSDIQKLQNIYHRKLATTSLKFKRYLYNQINWNVQPYRNLDNTNLMSALNTSNVEGMRRETFFANQVGTIATLTMPRQGDFMIDGKYLFEVGGHGKSFKQIANIPDSYLVIDDIETGNGSRIPLWMFGMLY